MRVRSRLERHSVDAAIAVLAGAAQAEAWLDPTQKPRFATALFALLWTLPLLLRRRFPLGAPTFVFGILAAETLLPGEVVTSSQATGLAAVATFAVAGTVRDLRRALAGAAAGFAALTAIIVVEGLPANRAWPVVVVGAIAWALGRAFGARAQRAADLEERAERLERAHAEAVAGERATIARELHDVIAHSVSVMTVQAGAARLVLEEDPSRARESLLAVEETGRQALAEMRRLLGILRGDEHEARLAPQPGVSELDALVEKVRAAGLPVDVIVEGEPHVLPPGTDLAAYRVVQEALTNALKHAGAARAQVSIRYGKTALELAVTNDGHAAPNGRVGHGLIGMRERVALYGGEFHAGPRPAGGYVVRATLPIDTPAP